jgi:hypothetical protein
VRVSPVVGGRLAANDRHPNKPGVGQEGLDGGGHKSHLWIHKSGARLWRGAPRQVVTRFTGTGTLLDLLFLCSRNLVWSTQRH